jgi:NTE family protein
MGGIIGACLSIGMKEKEIFELFENFSNISNWMKFSFTGNSIITNDKIFKILKSVFNDKKMKDTAIPLKLIATELLTGDIKVFDSTDDVLIIDALLATMAIPGVFEEKIINNIVYSDGFLSENLGVNYTSFDNILAIDVLGTNSFKNFLPDNFFKTNNILNMFEKSMRLLIYNQTRKNLKNLKNKNIKLIDIDTKYFKTFQFHKIYEIKELGVNLI